MRLPPGVELDESGSLIFQALSKYNAETVEEWITKNLPDNCDAPFGVFHKRFLNWVDALRPGVRQPPIVEAWGRGMGKTTVMESAIGFIAAKESRKFCLYVSATSDLAQAHLKEIASNLTQLDLEQDFDVNGKRVAWNRKQLRIKNFVIVAVGLNEAVRGIKIRNRRPDLIILDDFDIETDTPETRTTKLDAITKKILPTGAPDCCVCVMQNVITSDSIMSTLMKGTATFLLDRPKVDPVPMVYDPVVEIQTDENGRNREVLVGGTPAWPEGLPFEVCQQMVLTEGWPSFRKERCHITDDQIEYFFNVQWWDEKNESNAILTIAEINEKDLQVCMACDMAATAGGGDFTVIGLLGVDLKTDLYYVLDMVRGQWGAEEVEKRILDYAKFVRQRFDGRYTIRIPRDPAQAGKYQMVQLGRKLAAYNVVFETPSGTKGSRARGYAAEVNVGNVFLKKAQWNGPFVEEHRLFKDSRSFKGHDDIIDAFASSFSQLSLRITGEQSNRYGEEETEIEFATTETDPGPPTPWEIMEVSRKMMEAEYREAYTESA